jgi:hypothetical protein
LQQDVAIIAIFSGAAAADRALFTPRDSKRDKCHRFCSAWPRLKASADNPLAGSANLPKGRDAKPPG